MEAAEQFDPLVAGLMRGRVALVTGAGRNIGRAIAFGLASAGAAVVVNDVRREEAEATVAGIAAAGGQAIAAVADMSSPEAAARVVAESESSLGVVDVLVNNAYVRGPKGAWGPFLALDAAGWDEFTGSNLSLLFNTTHAVASRLGAVGRTGAIVNISSHGAARPHRNQIAYDTVKGAVESFTRAIAVDLAPWGIRANALRPGSIHVDDGLPTSPELQHLKEAQIPMGRAGRPEDVARCVVSLCSDLSAYVTGQVYNVDGGMGTQARAPQVEIDTVWTPANIGALRG